MKKIDYSYCHDIFCFSELWGTSSTDKDTLNVEIPLKTKSIAPYETDIPVKTGALESLLKCRRMVK